MNNFCTSNGPVMIREALPADAQALRTLRLEALARHPESFGADLALSMAESVEVWAERIAGYDAQSSGIVYAAWAEGQPVGMTGLVRGHWPKTRHSGTIWGVYVAPAWRGLRLAEALLEACCRWGQAHGLTVIKLAVVRQNTAAVRCYTRCGFAAYGAEPQALCYDGVYYDELLLARQLQGDDHMERGDL